MRFFEHEMETTWCKTSNRMMPLRLYSAKSFTLMPGIKMMNAQRRNNLPIDLNLMRLLQALVDTSSVSRAAERLGISQPAASHGMVRLRRELRDPLLVRTSRGYVLTALAEQLAAPVRRALAAADEVFEATDFVPQHANRCFHVASTDYGTTTVLLPVLAQLTGEAPHVSTRIDPWSDKTLSRLERGELDVALYADEPIPPDFHYRRLFTDSYALVCHREHPLATWVATGRTSQARQQSLLKESSRYPHFAPRFVAGPGFATDNVYDRLGLPAPHFVLQSPYFDIGIRSVLQAGLVSVLPHRLINPWSLSESLHVVRLDHTDLNFEYRLIWHERAHRDPALIWLRELIGRNAQV